MALLFSPGRKLTLKSPCSVWRICSRLGALFIQKWKRCGTFLIHCDTVWKLWSDWIEFWSGRYWDTVLVITDRGCSFFEHVCLLESSRHMFVWILECSFPCESFLPSLNFSCETCGQVHFIFRQMIFILWKPRCPIARTGDMNKRPMSTWVTVASTKSWRWGRDVFFCFKSHLGLVV